MDVLEDWGLLRVRALQQFGALVLACLPASSTESFTAHTGLMSLCSGSAPAFAESNGDNVSETLAQPEVLGWMQEFLGDVL